ncbi:MAG: hypothetical protein AB7O88_20965 [Reyranellaceae bacterium]
MLRRCCLGLLLWLVPTLAASAATTADCVADVRLEDRGASRAPSLIVAIACRADGTVRFAADDAAMKAHVGDARDGQGGAIGESDGSWSVPAQGGGATLRYAFDLSAYARDVDRATTALERGGAAMALLSSWLLEPHLPSGRIPVIDIRIAAPPELKVALALPPMEGGWRLQGTTVRFAGYSVVGRFDRERIVLPAARGNAVLDVARLDGALAVTRPELLDWIRKIALAEVAYWQGFTTSRVLLAIVPMPGRPGVVFGRVVPGGGVSVMLQLGARATMAELWDDWILPHEFVHTGMPMITGRSAWFMEGAATYVEPVIRARAGFKREAEVWREWIEHMPRGLSALRRGMSGGSPYWGGGLFMLLADIEIRRATSGAKGLEHCLRGALRAGGDMAPAERWPLATFAQRCDAALGAPVMAGMLERHLGKSVEIDLPALWRDLGVRLTADGIATDDSAPLAWIRKILVMGRAA